MAACEALSVPELAAVSAGAYPFSEGPEQVLHGVLDMLSGRYPSDEFAELRPRLTWDRLSDTLTARAGAQMVAVTSGGAIPHRGVFGGVSPEGPRAGGIDAERGGERRAGATCVLGARAWAAA